MTQLASGPWCWKAGRGATTGRLPLRERRLEVEVGVVRVAVGPRLLGRERQHNLVPGGLHVRRRVLPDALVAARDDAADQAQPEALPGLADRQALATAWVRG